MKTLIIVPAVPDVDYVIVDDGSKDATRRLCEEHGYVIVSHPVNLGLTGAFQTGMKYACRNGYDIALQLDADGQHVPSYVPRIIDTMQRERADIVIGSRFVSEKKPFSARMLGSNLISALIRITTGKRISDPTSGMRAYNRAMIEEFATRSDLSPEPDTLVFLIRKRHAKVYECRGAELPDPVAVDLVHAERLHVDRARTMVPEVSHVPSATRLSYRQRRRGPGIHVP